MATMKWEELQIKKLGSEEAGIIQDLIMLERNSIR